MASPDAQRILNSLLDRIERQPERSRRVSSRPPDVFGTLSDREAFEDEMKAAERLGAIQIEYGRRDSRHLIERVVLKDSLPLYHLLRREPLADRVAKSVSSLMEAFPTRSPDIAALVEEFEAGWSAVRQPYGIPLGDPRALSFVRALDAVLRRDLADKSDLRTYSRKSVGNSKLIEEFRGPIANWFKRADRVPDRMEEDEVFAALGLEKFAHPVLIAGPIAAGDADFSALPYVGFPAESLNSLHRTSDVRTVLTIENLASFHRHVREARRADDVVIFSGGFPSRAVLQAIEIAFQWSPSACYHWGDIDPSGISIALYISRATGTDLRPHLMDMSLAKMYGESAPASASLVAEGSRFAELAAFLCSAEARYMEQEQIDPKPPNAAH